MDIWQQIKVTSMRVSRRIGLPSCSQLTSCTGCPETMHWNWASLSTSTVCTWGCRWAVNGADAQIWKSHCVQLVWFGKNTRELIMYLLRLVWLESFLRPPYCSPSRGICRCLRVAPFGWGRRVWNARITWLFKRSIFRQLVLFIQAIRASNSRRPRHLFYIYVYTYTYLGNLK